MYAIGRGDPGAHTALADLFSIRINASLSQHLLMKWFGLEDAVYIWKLTERARSDRSDYFVWSVCL